MEVLDKEWNFIMLQTKHNLDLFEPVLAFRRTLLKVLGCEEHLVTHLFQSASALRKVFLLLSIMATVSHCSSYVIMILFSGFRDYGFLWQQLFYMN
jgi:hypothetical protein